MRAAQLTGWRAPLRIVDLPDPDCPADGVVLGLLACDAGESLHFHRERGIVWPRTGLQRRS